MVANNEEDDQRKPGVQLEKKIFVIVEPTSRKPSEMQEIAEIGETMWLIAVLLLEDPGNR